METPNRKVLIIGYYWPPAGGPGVQRWLKFAKYLPDFDIDPIMYVPENPHYPIVDEGLLAEVPVNITVIRRKIVEPYGFATFFSGNKAKKISSGIIPTKKKQSFIERALLWLRGNLFIPDARFLWVKPSVRFLKKYLAENKIDTVITTGPPHSLHLIGLNLQNSGIRWIADFRDPWTTIGYHKQLKLSAYAAARHKKLEARVLQSADEIIVTSATTKAEFEVLTQRPITVITNGFDLEKTGAVPLDDKFSLAHIGSFLSERNPPILWESLSELALENPDFAADLQIKLIGKTSQEVLVAIADFGLADRMINLGYVPHIEAIKHQKASQLLLLLEIDSPETKSIIPGKLFEYMVSGRPIIGIGPEGSDFAAIMKETNTGEFFTYKEKQALKTALSTAYKLFKQGALVTHPMGLQQYSRNKLTEKLANLLKS